MIEVGQQAPDVTAASTKGTFRLRDQLAAGLLVLFFFPKADTPG